MLVNGHGGNVGALDVVASRLRSDFGARHVVYLDEWALAREEFAELRESPPGGAAHACEYETSLYLHLRPEAVAEDRAVREMPTPLVTGAVLDLFAQGPYAAALSYDLSESGVIGDPTLATAEKGAQLFEAAVENLARLLEEVALLEG